MIFDSLHQLKLDSVRSRLNLSTFAMRNGGPTRAYMATMLPKV